MSTPCAHALLLGLLLAAGGCVARDAAPYTAGAPAAYGSFTIQGTVTYRQRVMLPPNAVLRVQLVDTARADAPAPVLAEQTIDARGRQVPIPYSLTVPAGVLTPTAHAVLRARIEVDGQLRFINTRAHPLSPQSLTRAVELVVEPVKSRAPSPQGQP